MDKFIHIESRVSTQWSLSPSLSTVRVVMGERLQFEVWGQDWLLAFVGFQTKTTI